MSYATAQASRRRDASGARACAGSCCSRKLQRLAKTETSPDFPTSLARND